MRKSYLERQIQTSFLVKYPMVVYDDINLLIKTNEVHVAKVSRNTNIQLILSEVNKKVCD